MYFTHPVSHTSIEQDPLGSSSLSGVDMGHNANIPGIIQIKIHKALIIS
jgi:hypothetical protein